MVSDLKYTFTILFIFNVAVKMGMAYLEYDGRVTVELQHAINAQDPEHFSYRGNITILSLNSGSSNAVQNPLTDSERHSFKTIAARNEFYRLRATVVYPNGKKRTFLTSNKACTVLHSQLYDELWLSIDGSGYVNSVTHSVPQSIVGDCSKETINLGIAKNFNTEVLVKHTELAPVPDTASYIQKLEREREAREKGETKDNRGFFAKYWMYIVPVVLLIFISGATNPEQPK